MGERLLRLHCDLNPRVCHLRWLCSFVSGVVNQEVQLRLSGAELMAGGEDTLHDGHVHQQPVDLPRP